MFSVFVACRWTDIPPQDCLASLFTSFCFHLVVAWSTFTLQAVSFWLQPENLAFTGRFQLKMIFCFWIGKKKVQFCSCATKLSSDTLNVRYASTGTWLQTVKWQHCASIASAFTWGISFYGDYWWMKSNGLQLGLSPDMKHLKELQLAWPSCLCSGNSKWRKVANS